MCLAIDPTSLDIHCNLIFNNKRQITGKGLPVASRDDVPVLPLFNGETTRFLHGASQFLEKLFIVLIRWNINTIEAET